MKKPTRWRICLLLLAFLLICSCSAALASGATPEQSETGYTPAEEMLDGTVVKWNDGAFLYGNFQYDMTKKALASKEYETVYFNNSEHPVRDLSGLQFVTALKTLYIQSNQLENLNLLPVLKKLETLLLVNVNSIDLTPLASCKKLKSLVIIDSDKLDFEPLRQCKALTSVHFQGLNIDNNDLEVLSSFKKLKGCTIENTSVDRLDSLGSLTNLTLLDVMNESPIVDYSALTGLKKLKTFSIKGIDSATLAQVLTANRKSLSNVTLFDVSMDDVALEALKGCSLQGLRLSNMQISKWPDDLLKGKKLKELFLNSTNVDHLNWLSQAKSIDTLQFITCELKDPTGIAALQKMKALLIGACKLPDYAFLNDLSCAKTLTGLVVNGSGLKDLSFIEKYPKVGELYLDGNEITDVSALAGTRIQRLSLYDNPVADYTPLQGMSNLWLLYHNENATIGNLNVFTHGEPYFTTDYRKLYRDTFESAPTGTEEAIPQ